ncbi:hypothetical protein GCM10010530_68970 [Kribbella aluminosa]
MPAYPQPPEANPPVPFLPLASLTPQIMDRFSVMPESTDLPALERTRLAHLVARRTPEAAARWSTARSPC